MKNTKMFRKEHRLEYIVGSIYLLLVILFANDLYVIKYLSEMLQ